MKLVFGCFLLRDCVYKLFQHESPFLLRFNTMVVVKIV